ncbi:unnamed protein product [Penicillium bialowiezense]
MGAQVSTPAARAGGWMVLLLTASSSTRVIVGSNHLGFGSGVDQCLMSVLEADLIRRLVINSKVPDVKDCAYKVSLSHTENGGYYSLQADRDATHQLGI